MCSSDLGSTRKGASLSLNPSIRHLPQGLVITKHWTFAPFTKARKNLIFKEITGGTMNKTKVYDAPTRLFHWLFAGLFLGAFAIAKLTDDESAFFSQHMLLGMLLTALTLLRILWGVVGSRYARFTSFPLNPKRLIEYFRDILTSKRNRHLAQDRKSTRLNSSH